MKKVLGLFLIVFYLSGCAPTIMRRVDNNNSIAFFDSFTAKETIIPEKINIYCKVVLKKQIPVIDCPDVAVIKNIQIFVSNISNYRTTLVLSNFCLKQTIPSNLNPFRQHNLIDFPSQAIEIDPGKSKLITINKNVGAIDNYATELFFKFDYNSEFNTGTKILRMTRVTSV